MRVHWKHGVLTTGPSGKSPHIMYFKKIFCQYLGTKEKVCLFVEYKMSQFSIQATRVPTSCTDFLTLNRLEHQGQMSLDSLRCS